MVLRVSGHVERDVSVLVLVKGLTRVGKKRLMLLLRRWEAERSVAKARRRVGLVRGGRGGVDGLILHHRGRRANIMSRIGAAAFLRHLLDDGRGRDSGGRGCTGSRRRSRIARLVRVGNGRFKGGGFLDGRGRRQRLQRARLSIWHGRVVWERLNRSGYVCAKGFAWVLDCCRG